MVIGIGFTGRGQIPRSELGPAMGPIVAAAGRIGIGFNRATEVLPLTPAYGWQASAPTDEPTTLDRRTREQAAADVGQAQAAIAGTASVGIGRFELRDVARVLGGVLQFGGRLLGVPVAAAVGQGLQRVAGPAAPRAPAPAGPTTVERTGPDVAGKAAAEAAIGPDGYTLQASRGVADLAAGVGSVQTVAVDGERGFAFEPFVFADGTAAGEGTTDTGGGGQRAAAQ